jgi:electron transfer flavoprotein beta subunit
MGADRALRVEADAGLDPLAVAKVLAAIVQRERPEIVLMGKQAIDDDSNQTGQMLAALLGVGQATFVSRLELIENNARARCARETDAGIETVLVTLPAVITTDLRLNEPRYVALPGIMKAKKKPVEELTLAGLGVNAASRTTVLRLEAPPRRKAGVRVPSVDDLVDRLRHEAKVI